MKQFVICIFIAAIFWGSALILDRKQLNEELIRFHVVANSDSAEDQAVKLQVRDAVIASLQRDLEKVSDVTEARTYLRENLPKIQRIANETLRSAGFDCETVVTLGKEAFDTRIYDTFSLPAGVYESLRIVIGDGLGKNWWCVTFPSLCVPATTKGFEEAAVGAGFSDTLSDTLAGQQEYEIRFFLLDAMGRLENILFAG